jgi:hypothetical protein
MLRIRRVIVGLDMVVRKGWKELSIDWLIFYACKEFIEFILDNLFNRIKYLNYSLFVTIKDCIVF